MLREIPEQAGRGCSYEQGNTGGRGRIIANGVKEADAALSVARPQRFWEAGDELFKLISIPVEREDRRAGRPSEDEG
jgi:hypothetical protein